MACENNAIKHELLIRRLQYRLKRQGMLELDVWLSPLHQALASQNIKLTQSIEEILMCEVPELLAMQTGQRPIPEELKQWLNISS